MNEMEVICYECIHYNKDCPLHGITDTMDKPLEGHMVQCNTYELNKELVGEDA